MEFNINSMKMRAKALMQVTKPNPMLVTLLFMAIAYAAYIIPMIGMEKSNVFLLIISIILSILKVFTDIGYSWYTLGIAREENPSPSVLFAPLTGFSIKAFVATLLKDILICVFFMLLYFPVIFPFYWFRPLYFIAKDNPDMSIIKMLSTSIKLMKGNKIAWFKLDLSFIGWIILNIITCGITNLYSLPLMSITYAEYYDFLKGKQSIMSAE